MRVAAGVCCPCRRGLIARATPPSLDQPYHRPWTNICLPCPAAAKACNPSENGAVCKQRRNAGPESEALRQRELGESRRSI